MSILQKHIIFIVFFIHMGLNICPTVGKGAAIEPTYHNDHKEFISPLFHQNPEVSLDAPKSPRGFASFSHTLSHTLSHTFSSLSLPSFPSVSSLSLPSFPSVSSFLSFSPRKILLSERVRIIPLNVNPEAFSPENTPQQRPEMRLSAAPLNIDIDDLTVHVTSARKTRTSIRILFVDDAKIEHKKYDRFIDAINECDDYEFQIDTDPRNQCFYGYDALKRYGDWHGIR